MRNDHAMDRRERKQGKLDVGAAGSQLDARARPEVVLFGDEVIFAETQGRKRKAPVRVGRGREGEILPNSPYRRQSDRATAAPEYGPSQQSRRRRGRRDGQSPRQGEARGKPRRNICKPFAFHDLQMIPRSVGRSSLLAADAAIQSNPGVSYLRLRLRRLVTEEPPIGVYRVRIKRCEIPT